MNSALKRKLRKQQRGIKTMTQTNFYELCNQHCILPAIALENDALIEALKNKDDAEVNRILTEDF